MRFFSPQRYRCLTTCMCPHVRKPRSACARILRRRSRSALQSVTNLTLDFREINCSYYSTSHQSCWLAEACKILLLLALIAIIMKAGFGTISKPAQNVACSSSCVHGQIHFRILQAPIFSRAPLKGPTSLSLSYKHQNSF